METPETTTKRKKGKSEMEKGELKLIDDNDAILPVPATLRYTVPTLRSIRLPLPFPI